jgi:hypothetical protein
MKRLEIFICHSDWSEGYSSISISTTTFSRGFFTPLRMTRHLILPYYHLIKPIKIQILIGEF